MASITITLKKKQSISIVYRIGSLFIFTNQIIKKTYFLVVVPFTGKRKAGIFMKEPIFVKLVNPLQKVQRDIFLFGSSSMLDSINNLFGISSEVDYGETIRQIFKISKFIF